MHENQKPFACSIEGCEMTFTNEDHLNWHHKKHDMMLNLGAANKNAEVADQTPTPTRFIRNCEEVGLFQDLQNVNPFDETFKKAIECSKSGTLHVPEISTNEDSLHTPHIFPLVEESAPTRGDSRSSDYNIITVTIPVPCRNENKDKPKATDLRHKLKETIQNKGKTTSPPTTTLIVTPASPATSESLNNRANVRNLCSNDKNQNGCDKAKIREINRMAQLRCRKRKQIQWKKMEEDVKILKGENTKLSHENQYMKHQLYLIKELIVNHKKDCPNSFLNKMEQIMNMSTQMSRKVNDKMLIPKSRGENPPGRKRNLASLLPVSLVQNPDQKPVFIQVLGSVSQVALSVLPTK